MTYRDYQMALDNRFETYDPELRAAVRQRWDEWVEEHVDPLHWLGAKNMGMWQRYNSVCAALLYYREKFGSEVAFE